jgi:hypothetical protein
MKNITTVGAISHEGQTDSAVDCSGNSAVVGRDENAGECTEVVSLERRPRQITPCKESAMNVNLSLAPLVALLAGILILVMPRLLNYIVAIYLIIIGLLGLLGGGGAFHFR